MYRFKWLLFLMLVSLQSVKSFLFSAETVVLVTDFSNDLPSPADASIFLRFKQIRPLQEQRRGDVVVELKRLDGAWRTQGHLAAADYNQKSNNTVLLDELSFDGATVSGKLVVTIGPDSPRPNKVGFPNPQDRFEIEISAGVRNDNAPFLPDTQAFMPPWRKDIPDFGGQLISGTYRARWIFKEQVEEVQGEVAGALSPGERKGRFGASGNLVMKPVRAGGLQLLARLAPHRVMDRTSAMAEKIFEAPQDWRTFEGLRLTIVADRRRNETGVCVRLQESSGSWYEVTHGALIFEGRHVYDIPFADFRGGTGGNYFFELNAIDRLAIGVNSGEGVGDVVFTIEKIECYHAGRPEVKSNPVRLDFDPETIRSINGQTQIPKGLFGFHDVGNPHDLEGPEGVLTLLKVLNCGYLRPLHHTGFGGNRLEPEKVAENLASRARPGGNLYRRADASNALDNLVICHTQDLWNRPGWMDQPEDRFLQGIENFYHNLASQAWTPEDIHNYQRRFEVWNEPFMWGRHINMGHQQPAGLRAWVDETQYGYIPGELGSAMYAKIFLAASRGVKAVNPHVLLGGPSAPAFNSDNYGVFLNHVARVIDLCAEQFDFLTEHHYGGFRQSFPASYEVATAYMDTRHNRRIPIYNTECNDLGGDDLDKAHYNIEEILWHIIDTPDKSHGRAMHALWNGRLRSKGELHAYTVLNELRGQMLVGTGVKQELLFVASHPGKEKCSMVIFNNSPLAVEIELPLHGFALERARLMVGDEGIEGEGALNDTEGQTVPPPDGMTELVENVPLKIIEGSIEFKLPSRAALALMLHREEYEPKKVLFSTQHYFEYTFSDVAPDKPVTGSILWRDKPAQAEIRRAWLRLITQDVQREEGVLQLGERRIALPWSTSNGGAVVIQEIELDPAAIEPEMRLEFKVSAPARFNGYRILAASIRLEH